MASVAMRYRADVLILTLGNKWRMVLHFDLNASNIQLVLARLESIRKRFSHFFFLSRFLRVVL